MRIFNKKYGELVAHTADVHLNATIDAHDDVAFVGNYITTDGEVVRGALSRRASFITCRAIVQTPRRLCEGDAERAILATRTSRAEKRRARPALV